MYATVTLTASSRQVTSWSPIARLFKHLEETGANEVSMFSFQGRGDQGKLGERTDFGAAIV